MTEKAGWWRRFFAWWYELLLLVPVLLLAQVVFQGVYQLVSGASVMEIGRDPVASGGNFAWLLATAFAYFSWCWRHSGQTLAMKTWRIRLETVSGAALGWRAAVLRFVTATLCYLPLVPLWMLARRDPYWIPYAWLALAWFVAPFVWAWLDRDGQLLHDRVAGTRQVFAPGKKGQQQQGKPPVTDA
ncbi:RDD family protein [Chitinibacteraceae bacterium HSL-7]